MVRRFLRFGFSHGSSGSRFLWFVSYLIFCGSVRRFWLGSWTLLWRKSGCVSCPGGLLGLSSGKLWGGASCHSSWPSGARKLFPTSVHQHSLLKAASAKKTRYIPLPLVVSVFCPWMIPGCFPLRVSCIPLASARGEPIAGGGGPGVLVCFYRRRRGMSTSPVKAQCVFESLCLFLSSCR